MPRYKIRTLFLLIIVGCVVLRFLVVNVKRTEFSTFDLSLRTVEYVRFAGTKFHLTRERVTCSKKTQLSIYLAKNGYLSSSMRSSNCRFIVIREIDRYSEGSNEIYYHLWKELQQSDQGYSWIEWSEEHPDDAKLFWNKLLFYLRNPTHDDGKSLILVKQFENERSSKPKILTRKP